MKKINLDFTSLLDILLILLFAFIINSNSQTAEKENRLLAELENTNHQKEALQSLLKQKDDEMKELKKNLADSEAQRLQQEEYVAQYKDALTKTLKELKEHTQTPNLSLQKWHNYKFIANKFLIFNVSIVTPDNQLIINDKKMPFYLSFEEVSSEETRLQKIKQLEDLIEKEIDNSIHSGNLILISAGKDSKIERQVYLLLWDAIRNVENKYGKERLFKTEFYLP